MRFYHRFVDETLDDNGTLQQFSLHYPDNFNFGYDVVDAIADEAPQRRALVWCNQRGDERTFTFSEIKDLSNRAANFFRAQGVKQGDRVMVMLKRHHEYWYTLVGLHKLGAVVIPATHMLTTKDMEYRINAVGIRTVVVTGEDGTAEALAHCKCASLQAKIIVHGSHPGFVDFAQGIADASPELERVPTKVTDPFLLYFTSGTTGQPKAVMHDFTYPLGHVVTARHWQNVRDGGLHLSVSDTGWAKASWGKIYGQWLSGAAVMVYDYDQFSPHKLLEIIQKYGVDTFCAPPTVFRYLVKRKIPNGMFSSVQYAVTAGEALNPEIAVKFQEQTGLTLHEGFGQTEAVLMVGNLVGMPVRPGSMGKPSPLYHIELLKEDGTYAKDGEEGEMVVVPPENGVQHGVFMGYDGDEDLYRWVWRGGVYHTRDIARRDRDGYYWYCSRTDDVIKSSGYRISPFEVESVLMEHPAVMECAVVGVPDLDRGAAIKAFIVPTHPDADHAELTAQLRHYMAENAASYKHPKLYEFVSEMPKTISGKIRRVELREGEKNKS